MPVYSMTGYASGQNGPSGSHAEADARPSAAGRLGVEIRSVNSRFLDLTFKLPEELRQHETALRELLTGRLKRGKVELRAAIESNAQGGVAEPSVKLLQRLNGVQDGIKAWLPGARELSVADVLRLAGSDSAPRGDWGADLLEVAGKALEALVSARQREGARLAKMLEAHLGQLRELVAQAGPLVPQLVEQQRTRFLERWQEAMGLGANGGGTLPEAAQDLSLIHI